MLHLMAATAAGARSDHDTAATHLAEASALTARMDTEVGTWAHLWFGSTNVGIWRTSLAVEVGEHGQALEATKTVHSELLPGNVRRAPVLGRGRPCPGRRDKDPRQGRPCAGACRAPGSATHPPRRVRP